jgi:hypothetical protein
LSKARATNENRSGVFFTLVSFATMWLAGLVMKRMSHKSWEVDAFQGSDSEKSESEKSESERSESDEFDEFDESESESDANESGEWTDAQILKDSLQSFNGIAAGAATTLLGIDWSVPPGALGKSLPDVRGSDELPGDGGDWALVGAALARARNTQLVEDQLLERQRAHTLGLRNATLQEYELAKLALIAKGGMERLEAHGGVDMAQQAANAFLWSHNTVSTENRIIQQSGGWTDRESTNTYTNNSGTNDDLVVFAQPTCRDSGTLETAFENIVPERTFQTRVGWLIDPRTNLISEVYEDLPPPAQGDFSTPAELRDPDRDNRMLINLQGGYDPSNPGPTRREWVGEAPVAESIHGDAEYSDRRRQMEYESVVGDVALNRDGMQEQSDQDRYPDGYVGYQHSVPYESLVGVVPATLRGHTGSGWGTKLREHEHEQLAELGYAPLPSDAARTLGCDIQLNEADRSHFTDRAGVAVYGSGAYIDGTTEAMVDSLRQPSRVAHQPTLVADMSRYPEAPRAVVVHPSDKVSSEHQVTTISGVGGLVGNMIVGSLPRLTVRTEKMARPALSSIDSSGMYVAQSVDGKAFDVATSSSIASRVSVQPFGAQTNSVVAPTVVLDHFVDTSNRHVNRGALGSVGGAVARAPPNVIGMAPGTDGQMHPIIADVSAHAKVHVFPVLEKWIVSAVGHRRADLPGLGGRTAGDAVPSVGARVSHQSHPSGRVDRFGASSVQGGMDHYSADPLNTQTSRADVSDLFGASSVQGGMDHYSADPLNPQTSRADVSDLFGASSVQGVTDHNSADPLNPQTSRADVSDLFGASSVQGVMDHNSADPLNAQTSRADVSDLFGASSIQGVTDHYNADPLNTQTGRADVSQLFHASSVAPVQLETIDTRNYVTPMSAPSHVASSGLISSQVDYRFSHVAATHPVGATVTPVGVGVRGIVQIGAAIVQGPSRMSAACPTTSAYVAGEVRLDAPRLQEHRQPSTSTGAYASGVFGNVELKSEGLSGVHQPRVDPGGGYSGRVYSDAQLQGHDGSEAHRVVSDFSEAQAMVHADPGPMRHASIMDVCVSDMRGAQNDRFSGQQAMPMAHVDVDRSFATPAHGVAGSGGTQRLACLSPAPRPKHEHVQLLGDTRPVSAHNPWDRGRRDARILPVNRSKSPRSSVSQIMRRN